MNDKRHSSSANHSPEIRRRVSNRIIGFSDGVFAIAITLLVLTINVPSNLTSSEDVSGFLWQALPQLVAYAAAFMVIGTFWLRHHRMLMLCRAVDGRMLVLNLVFLAFVCLLPFPTDLLGNVQTATTVIAFCAVARDTSRTHCIVNDVEVGGAWRLHHPPRSVIVLSEDRSIAGVSTSSALRNGFPSSLSSPYPHSLSASRRLIAELELPRRILLGNSVNKRCCC